jgi:hypothetical protein
MSAWQSTDLPVPAVALTLSDSYFAFFEFEAAVFRLGLHDGCLAVLKIELVEHFGAELVSDGEEMRVSVGFVDVEIVESGDGGLAGKIGSSESLDELAELSAQCLPVETCPECCLDSIN